MPGLTEAAAARTPAKQLHHRAVEHDIGGRDDERFRIVHRVEILYNALLHLSGRAVYRRNAFHRAVLVVAHLVQRRHVDARNAGGLTQKAGFVPAFPLGPTVQIGELKHDLFPVADQEHIDKIGQRLRVIGARSAADDQMGKRLPLRRKHRDTAEIQHVQDVGEGKLVLQCKTDYIEQMERITALQRVQRDARAAQFVLHIDPRRANALAPNAGLIV